MINKTSILLLSFLVATFSYSQSVIGFSTGAHQLMAYESIPDNNPRFNISELEEKTSGYLSFYYKQRSSKNFNLGLEMTINSLNINYSSSDVSHIISTYKDISYRTYLLNNRINFELRLIKQNFYINFGPSVSVPIYSYKEEAEIRWGKNYPNGESFSKKGKNYDAAVSFKVFTNLFFEKSISERFIFLARTEINYSVFRTYQGIKTYDFSLGLGLQYSLPNFTLFG